MTRGKTSLAVKFSQFSRTDLEAKARTERKDMSQIGYETRRLDLLTCRELVNAMHYLGGVGSEAGELLLKKVTVFEDALDAARIKGQKAKHSFLFKAAELCTTIEEAHRLYQVWPKLGQNKEVLMKKVCEIAKTKEELAEFVLQNQLI